MRRRVFSRCEPGLHEARPEIEAKITAIAAINASIFIANSKTQVKTKAIASILPAIIRALTDIDSTALTYGKTYGAVVHSTPNSPTLA